MAWVGSGMCKWAGWGYRDCLFMGGGMGGMGDISRNV
jgi:hypothetical protein